MRPSYIIVDEFRDIVEKASLKLTPVFKELDPLITALHYDHGHPAEIIETLRQKDDTQTFRFDKYPLIALFQDFDEVVKPNSGIQSEVSLNLIIARPTLPEYKASERYEKNFRPFLYPAYDELLYQINKSKAFLTKGVSLIEHTKIDRLYWGRKGLFRNQGNIFNDWLDCIEIKNLKLKVNLKIC